MLVPDELETPAVVVDAWRLERNLTRMAAAAGAAGVALRPHAKTHKCLPIAGRQLSLGAVGLTVATLLEAELFASEGCRSVFVAYPLWAGSGDRGARLAALRGLTSLRVGVDGEAAAAALAAAAPGLAVLIEVDSGQHRSGVAVDRVAALAVSCAKLGLTVAGAFTHPGHAYSAPSAAGDAARDERAALAAAGEALTAPASSRARRCSAAAPPHGIGRGRGAADGGAARNVRVRRPAADAPVRAQRQRRRPRRRRPRRLRAAPGEAVLDAGSKALSSDRPAWLAGHGLILEAPEATIAVLSEEHAVVRDLLTPLKVGNLVRVIPNHVCTVVNLTSELVVVSDGAVTDLWPVSARR